MSQQWYYVAGGTRQGPVDKDEIFRLIQMGTIGPNDLVWREGYANWVQAGSCTELVPPDSGSAYSGPGTTSPYGGNYNSYGGGYGGSYGPGYGRGHQGGYGGSQPYYGYGYARPHRGGTILALSLVGLFCCAILSIVAWVMAAGDLNAMKSGQMDPSGRGLTVAGMVIAIISVVFTALMLLGAMADSM